MRAGLARDVRILRRANPSAPEATGAALQTGCVFGEPIPR